MTQDCGLVAAAAASDNSFISRDRHGNASAVGDEPARYASTAPLNQM